MLNGFLCSKKHLLLQDSRVCSHGMHLGRGLGLFSLTWVRPPCQHPPGVIGDFGGDKIDFSFNGVAYGSDGHWAPVIL